MSSLLDLWNSLCLTICDPLLGWMLWLPTDLLLLLLAILTSVLMTAIRRYTSNQDLLTRLDADKKLLKTLQNEAKAKKDSTALARFKVLATRHAIKALGQEGKPLLWSILPIALLATWAFQRVEFLPPKSGETLEVSLLTAAKHDGQLAHVIPQPGVNPDRSVQVLSATTAWGQQVAKATWTLKPEPGTYKLTVRSETGTYDLPLAVGSKKYESPLVTFPDESAVEVKLQQRKLFGIVPGIEAIGFAPWLIGYLLLVLPLVFLVRPLMKTH
jgi:uncharacterized membrane protein (DUF106 family)